MMDDGRDDGSQRGQRDASGPTGAAELDALLAQLEASAPDLDSLLASLNAETDALLATLEADTALADLLARLEAERQPQ